MQSQQKECDCELRIADGTVRYLCMKLKQKDLCFVTTDTPDIVFKGLCVLFVLINVFIQCVIFFVFEYRVIICMWVCFHFTAFESQPSELFQKGQPLDVQNRYGEF